MWFCSSPETMGGPASTGKWKKAQAVLLGYSLGADLLPAMAARIEPVTRARVRLITLLAPGTQAAFEFHLGFTPPY